MLSFVSRSLWLSLLILANLSSSAFLAVLDCSSGGDCGRFNGSGGGCSTAAAALCVLIDLKFDGGGRRESGGGGGGGVAGSDNDDDDDNDTGDGARDTTGIKVIGKAFFAAGPNIAPTGLILKLILYYVSYFFGPN